MGTLRRAMLLLLTVLVAGCSSTPGTPDDREVAAVPEVAGTWERLPDSPLLPRGGTQAIWTGSEIVFWGGQAVDQNEEPCPPAASCAGPPPGPEAEEAAAYDPSTRTWRRLDGTPPTYGPAVWTGDRIVDQSTRYDLATQLSTNYPPNDLLVYASVQIVGSDLVEVGWDYGPGDANGAGQVAAASLDLTDPAAQWRQVEWPLPPPGAEGLQTATDGASLLVVSAVHDPDLCGQGPDCSRMLRFAPSTGTWTELTPDTIPSLTTGHGQVLGTVQGGSLPDGSTTTAVVSIDPSDGSVVASLGDTGSFGDLLVSPTGGLALVGGPDVRVRGDDGRWLRLPDVPGNPTHPAYVWAGEDLVVWGGAATIGDRDSRNSADGYVFRPA